MNDTATAKKFVQQAKKNRYEDTVIDFIRTDGGRIIAETHDQSFISLLRSVLSKELGLGSLDMLRVEHGKAGVLKAVGEIFEAGHIPLLFMESSIKDLSGGHAIKELKTAFPNLLIIILGVEMSQRHLLHLHESGANNFIAKPISAKALIEKMAFSIKPQTQLGLLIDEAKEFLRLGQPEKARETAHRVLEMKPHSPAGLLVLGDAELAMGNRKEARAAYLEAHEHADLYLEPLARLAALAEKTNEHEECLHWLEELDALSPLNSDRKITMGSINLTLGKDEKAEQLFEESLELVIKEARDRIAETAARVAQVYAESKPDMAEKFLRKAMQARRKGFGIEDLPVFNQLGISLRRQGKWKEAVESYRKALEIAPKDENLLYNLALAYADGNMFREARQHMERALGINDNLPRSSPAAAYWMGMIFMNGGDKERARRCLNVALELQPGLGKAREALKRLG